MGKTRKGLEYLLCSLAVGMPLIFGSPSPAYSAENKSAGQKQKQAAVCDIKEDSTSLLWKAHDCSDIAGKKELYSKVIKNYPDTSSAHLAELDMIGFIDGAENRIKAYKKLIQKKPNKDVVDECRLNMGEIYTKLLDMPEKALAEYKRVKDPGVNDYGYNEALLGIADICDKLGRTEEAIKKYEELLLRNKEDKADDAYASDACTGLAKIYEKKGDLNKAIEQYETLLEMTHRPNNFGSIYEETLELARLYRITGNKEKAIENYENFIKCYPHGRDKMFAEFMIKELKEKK